MRADIPEIRVVYGPSWYSEEGVCMSQRDSKQSARISLRRMGALAVSALVAGGVVAAAAAAFGNPARSQASPGSGSGIEARLAHHLGRRQRGALFRWNAPNVPKARPVAAVAAAAPTTVTVAAPPATNDDHHGNSGGGSNGGDGNSAPPPSSSGGGGSDHPSSGEPDDGATTDEPQDPEDSGDPGD